MQHMIEMIAAVFMLTAGLRNGMPKQTYPSTYPATAIVMEVDTEKDEVTSTVPTSYPSYTKPGAEDWMTGDIASMLMSDMGTPEIKDDRILKAYYSGLTISDVDGFLDDERKG